MNLKARESFKCRRREKMATTALQKRPEAKAKTLRQANKKLREARKHLRESTKQLAEVQERLDGAGKQLNRGRMLCGLVVTKTEAWGWAHKVVECLGEEFLKELLVFAEGGE